MKIRFLLCLLFFCQNILSGFSQEIFTDIHGKKVTELIKMERQFNGVPFDSKRNYISPFNLAKPLIFRRKQQLIPDVLVYYNFIKKDSLMNSLLYEWDVSNFDESDKIIEPEKFQKAMIDKYKKLLKQLTTKYGQSIVKGDLSDLSQVEKEHGLQRSDLWQVNDSTEIHLYTVISNYYKKEENLTIAPSHRIRLYINNIVKKTEPVLNEDKVREADMNLRQFTDMLVLGKFTVSREFLALKLRDLATDVQLASLKESIIGKGKMTILTKGFQQNLDGTYYLVIQYRYGEVGTEAPKEILQVVFDTDQKILGITPLKR